MYSKCWINYNFINSNWKRIESRVQTSQNDDKAASINYSIIAKRKNI